MKTKYVKLFEEYSQEQQFLTDPVKIKEWIDSWKDVNINAWISKDANSQTVPLLNGTYTIRPNGVVDVEGSVYLQWEGLEYIPVQFGKVTEDFYCFDNQLTSLKGCPTSVGGDFYCYDNPKLKSLQYCPTSVFGIFSCADNQLTSLQYCPTSVGGFNCSRNPKLITNAHNSNVKGKFYSDGIKGTLEERILRYIEYLKPLNQQERDSSLDWLYSVDEDLHKEAMDYITKNNIDVFSGRVKSIYTKTNTQNKRMPLF